MTALTTRLADVYTMILGRGFCVRDFMVKTITKFLTCCNCYVYSEYMDFLWEELRSINYNIRGK